MAKKTKRYDNGGEIVVSGNRPTGPANLGSLGSYSLNPAINTSVQRVGSSSSSGGRGGSALGQRLAPLAQPGSMSATGPRFAPAVVTQPQSALGNLVGAHTPTAYGVSGRFNFKEGGKVKAKKLAKGGSTASKRADGCATKGKTKGRFV